MKKQKCIGFIFFISIFLLSTSSALAHCSMPGVYREGGSGLDLVSGVEDRRLITIDQANYPSQSWIQYNLQIKNKNSNQGMLVWLEPLSSDSNIRAGSVLLGPDEKSNLTLDVWVRQSKDLMFVVTGICDDGTMFRNPNPTYSHLGKIEFEIESYLDDPPQNGCNIPPSACNMTTGLYTAYYCDGSETKPNSLCVESCCKTYGQQFGDDEAFCSNDRHACISAAATEPTEGSIAFLCKSDDCKYEKDIILTLRLFGWGVDGKSYKSWLETDFDNYDIIACYHQDACKIKFNSPAYNQYIVNRKPFLEIASSKSSSAAYEFGYIAKSSGSSGKEMFFATTEDELTEGFYNSFVDVISKSKLNFAVIEDQYLDGANNPELIDLADSGNNSKKPGSIFFKAGETVGHGNYAFIGWLPNFNRGELTSDGDTILKRTLNWLKNTSQIGERKNIAFLCSKGTCSDKDEIDLIKMFRRWGFLVDGKSLKSWGSEINDYDLIVCRNSRSSCKIPITSPVYSAHMDNSIPFLEIPETSKAYAAEIFGINVSKLRRYSNYSVQVFNPDPIVSGLGDPISIFTKKRPIIGVEATGLTSANDIAHIPNLPSSALFTSQSNYAFIGWLGKGNMKYMNENAKEILHRTVNWLACGNVSC